MWRTWQEAIARVVLTSVGQLVKDQYYIQMVPPNAVYPYVMTKEFVASVPRHVMGGGKPTEEFIWSFTVVCDLANGGPVEVNSIMSKLIPDVEDAVLTLDSFRHIGMLRILETSVLQDSKEEDVFYSVVKYKVWIKKQD